MENVEERNEEYIFYLSLIIKERFLKDSYILLDVYYDKIIKIYYDYIKNENFKKSLFDSINDYLDNNKNYIYNILNDVKE